MKYYLIILFIGIFFFSCKPKLPPSHIQEIINQAGVNKKELEKAIKYFQRSRDTLKLKACYFLIENMTGHYSFDNRNNKYFDQYFKIFAKKPRDQKDNIIDSLRSRGIVAEPFNKKIYDIKNITADYLIVNINLAFKEWNNTSWKDIYPFYIFCEYVLPYRVKDQLPLEDWRQFLKEDYKFIYDSLNSKSDIKTVYSALFREIKGEYFNTVKNLFPQPLSIENSHKAKVGLCSDACNYFVATARSFGIPTFTDCTPVWGNFRMGHTWNSLILPDSSIVSHLRLEEQPQNYGGMIHAMRDFDYNNHKLIYSADELSENNILRNIINNGIFKNHEVNIKHIPKNMMILKQKKISKVFRFMYSIQKSSLGYIEKNHTIIPLEFRDYYIKDVTSDYFEGLNISVKLDSITKDKYVFLCIFKKGGFVPVDWSVNDSINKIARFNNIGDKILYFIMYYRLGKYIPAASPFVLKSNGEFKYFTPHNTSKENIKIFRKFPLRLRTIYYSNFMLGGKFQVSNDPNFKNFKELYEIKKTPLTWSEIIINEMGSFQYIRYINEHTTGDIGEFEIYSTTSGQEIKLKGKIISSENEFNNSPTNAFDKNLTTFSRGSQPGDWIGLDFGKKIKIDKIRFYPRFDSNEIIPGQYYELMYWNNGWKSLGKKIAKKEYLIFENVPSNCLLWLINHSGGNEERPFSYNEGMQIWW